AVVDLVPHRDEDRLELLAHDGERMPAPERRPASGQADVDGLGRELQISRPRLVTRPVFLDLHLEVALERVELGAHLLARVGRQATERLHEAGDLSRLAAEETVL